MGKVGLRDLESREIQNASMNSNQVENPCNAQHDGCHHHLSDSKGTRVRVGCSDLLHVIEEDAEHHVLKCHSSNPLHVRGYSRLVNGLSFKSLSI
jgi:hypothetical protein